MACPSTWSAMPTDKVTPIAFFDSELIDNVDFNKGPYYTQQGDFTTAGYANFNTRNALARSSIKLETGRFDTYRAVGLLDLLGKNAGSQQMPISVPT